MTGETETVEQGRLVAFLRSGRLRLLTQEPAFLAVKASLFRCLRCALPVVGALEEIPLLSTTALPSTPLHGTPPPLQGTEYVSFPALFSGKSDPGIPPKCETWA